MNSGSGEDNSGPDTAFARIKLHFIRTARRQQCGFSGAEPVLPSLAGHLKFPRHDQFDGTVRIILVNALVRAEISIEVSHRHPQRQRVMTLFQPCVCMFPVQRYLADPPGTVRMLSDDFHTGYCNTPEWQSQKLNRKKALFFPIPVIFSCCLWIFFRHVSGII